MSDSEDEWASRPPTAASLKTHKGHLTRSLTWLEELIHSDVVKSELPSQATIDRLRDLVQQNENRFKNIESICNYLGTDESTAKQYSKYLDEVSSRMQVLFTEAYSSIAKISMKIDAAAQQRAGGNAAGGTGATEIRRIDGTLKPFLLSDSHKPSQVSDWKEKFTSWYRLNKLDEVELSVQQTYFKNYLDSQLCSRLTGKYDAVTPIFSGRPEDISMMSIIEDEFDQIWPLVNRRVAYFAARQRRGESWPDFAGRIRALAVEAELSKLTEDDLLMVGLVGGTADEELKRLLTREHRLTLKKVYDIAGAYTASEHTVQPSSSQAARVQNTAKGRHVQSGQGNNRGRSQSRGRSQTQGQQACGSCGFKHEKGHCPAYDKICRNCSKKGHFAKMCRAKKRQSSPRPSSPRGNGRGRSTQHNRGVEVEDKDDLQAGQAVYSVQYKNRNVSVHPTPRMLTTLRDAENKKAPTVMHRSLPDSGCTSTLIGDKLAAKLQLKINPKGRERLIAANKAQMKCLGSVFVEIEYLNKKIMTHCLVTPDLGNDLFIGWSELVLLGVLNENFPRPSLVNAVGQKAPVTRQAQERGKSVSRPDHLPIGRDISDSEGVSVEDFEILLEVYKDVFDDTVLKPMKGDPVRIELRKDVEIKPTRTYTARKVPVHYEEQGKQMIAKMLEDGIIEKADYPTDWVSPSFFVPKPMGKIRFVTDFSALNRALLRPGHPFPSPRDLIRNIPPDSKYFLKVDVKSAYHQIVLAEECRDLFAFLVPWGKMRYCRLPMGSSPSSDIYCQRSDEALEGLPISKIVDDILAHSPNMHTLYRVFKAVLERCRAKGITLSKSKVEACFENESEGPLEGTGFESNAVVSSSAYKKGHALKAKQEHISTPKRFVEEEKIKLNLVNSLHFAGLRVSANKVMPDEEKTGAIRDFPQLKNQTDVRSFIGLAQTLGSFIPDLAQVLEPIRGLLKKNSQFLWSSDQEQAFQKAKEILTSDLVVHFFDKSLKSELLTDASRSGLGYALIQRDTDGKPRLISCGSRALNEHEVNYSVTELEMLAVVWSVKQCKYYLHGSSFTCVSDHRSLLGVFKKKLADIDNSRLLRLRLKLTEYDITLAWIPGAMHKLPDALSRMKIAQDKSPQVCCVSSNVNKDDFFENIEFCNKVASDPILQEVFDECENDTECKDVIEMLKNGVKAHNIPPSSSARQFKRFWDDLSVHEDVMLLYEGNRVVVPRALRGKYLKLLHLGHCGLTKSENWLSLHVGGQVGTQI